MRNRLYLSAICAAMLAAAPVTVQAQEVKVIVNSASSVGEMPAAEVSNIFLKKTAKFPGGAAAVPVDQAKGSAVRSAFSKSVLGRPAAAVDAYWQQQIFAGGELPPSTKASDDDVVAFVKATPGAIGYVSSGASVAGVKVVTVK